MFSTLHKKYVTFADGVKKEGTTSFLSSEKKPSFATMTKWWFKYASDNKYEELKQYLTSCIQKGIVIEDFFSQEGRLILSWTISQANINPLKFIYENISHNIIQIILNQNDYLLESFLQGQSGLDERNWTTSEDLEVTIKKFELLLKMGVRKLIETALLKNKNSTSGRVTADFKVSLEKYEDEIKSLSTVKPQMI